MIGQFATIISSTRDSSKDLPDPSTRVAELLGATNLDVFVFIPVDCIFTNLGSWFYSTLVIKTIGPIIPLVLLWLWVVAATREGGIQAQKRMRTAAQFSILWIQLILPSVSTTTVQTFVCESFDDDDFLAVELTVSCSSRRHRFFWKPWAIFSLLIYPIGPLY